MSDGVKRNSILISHGNKGFIGLEYTVKAVSSGMVNATASI